MADSAQPRAALTMRRTRWRARLSAAVAVLSIMSVAACVGSGPPRTARKDPSPTASTPSAQARVVASRELNARMRDLTIVSPAVGAKVKVRLLLPAGFDAARNRHWPVLYLLHGCCDDYTSWTRWSDIESLARHLEAIVVMPDGGGAGFYSDWLSGPGWETFHLNELRQLLTHRYRASGRAVVAGESMGGLGALDYAARHPGMFKVAASFSGIVDTRLSADESRRYLALLALQGKNPFDLWGDPQADVAVWKAHNPYDLAPRLVGTRLFVSAGNGQPGPLDGPNTGPDQLEASIGAENTAFVKRIRALGLDARIDLYGPGTHSTAYWQRELHRAWPLIEAGLGVR